MRTIRNNTFETNSSSTHSIVISKNKYILPKRVIFEVDEFGWEHDTRYNTSDYLFTAILQNDNREKNIERLKSILDKNNISYTFPEEFVKDNNIEAYNIDGYIDHAGELEGFLEDLLNNEDKLLRFLLSDSYIITGNDNDYDDEDNSLDYDDEDIYYKGN